ncbi:Transcriptional regulator, contains XRE-family HTH domain [Paenibacillus sp. UNCCL117]|uniref:helix-turn-helix domain-containing protein n=1 Tax=unclassified Paenibacillus TaxID=185978 RepID=UPI000889B7A6|nr:MULTISPECIES: helix-turn-helix transcriptional regulator [unclassified Paenibacillus]SDD48424.1 Transcriptional regulator, contains XRE-family HTH domain [Paenibacillus sp. cl123]SFW50252.1 Transcriptional regulator, contains XRE-family HTH domain [Paenibacillus sp. UNCCL117]
MSLGSRIRDLRKKYDLTQLDIAEQLGMGRSNFGHIENDRVIPSSEDLQRIADILHTTTDYLLGRSMSDPLPGHTAPAWATSKDKRDFKRMLEEDGEVMFDGIPMSEKDRQRVLDVLTGLFWEAKQMNKRKKVTDPKSDAAR